ncbi:MAG: hypothetical protein ACJAR0_000324 [Candidatus Azotimanducaceae bacterium]|jgi:hypothetical protein
MQTRLAIIILFIGVLQCVLLLLIADTPAPDLVTGLAHDQFPGMRVGGDGVLRLLPIADYAFYFQLLALAQICVMIALGVSPRKRSPVFWLSLLVSFVLAALVWWQMFTAYEQFLSTGKTEFFAGFPIATAWQVYATWLAGLSLVGLYVIGFKHYVWSDEDQEMFDRLVKSSSESSSK